VCVDCSLILRFNVRLYSVFVWCAYGTFACVNWLWTGVRVWVCVHVSVGVLRVCLFLRIIVWFSEVSFRFRGL
jgi:hypothetical protein